MLGGVLGFDKTTPKSKVGEYFNQVKATVEGTKEKLNTIVENMKREGNPNASKTEAAVTTFLNEKLNKIIEGASEAIKGAGGGELIGNVVDSGGGAGAGAKGDYVEHLVKGIGKIVDVVLKDEGKHDAGDGNKPEGNAQRGTDAGDAGKLFGNAAVGDGNATKKFAGDAAKAVGAVTGADILKAIIKDGGDAAKFAKELTGNVSAIPKNATIAGGITLRAMAKDGKFAGPSENNADAVAAVKGAAVSAVTKALNTLAIAIRKTIDEGLKEVKKAMNINANDSPVTSATGAAAK